MNNEWIQIVEGIIDWFKLIGTTMWELLMMILNIIKSLFTH